MKRVLVAGQKHFGMAVANLVRALCRYELAAVSAPVGGKPDSLAEYAAKFGVPVIPAGSLSPETVAAACPAGIDLLITAHCHDFIRRPVRDMARIGCLGYHPSLLPLWRGRTAIESAIAAGDRVTGGTVYWLDSTFDGGPIAAQRHAIIPVGSTAASLWRDVLQPLGLNLLAETLIEIDHGFIPRSPQDDALATCCPVAA